MKLSRLINGLIIVIFLITVSGGLFTFAIFWKYSASLPDYSTLKNYDPPVITRVFSSDGKLLDEFSIEERLFIPIEQIPQKLIHAFISAEDKNFYSHFGVDPFSIFKAVIININNLMNNKRPVGASTITQQVAKNFLLSNEFSLERKIKEAILSLRIERYLTKNQILELYLNEIYLGLGSYGVASASLNYFNKSLDELTLTECAYLAALPKAPNNYHPIKNKSQAIARRNWVLKEMNENNYISSNEKELSLNADLLTRSRDEKEFYFAKDFTEEVRKFLYKQYGYNTLYSRGLSVRSTIDTFYQDEAYKVLKWGLEKYDSRHGWRGPIDNIKNDFDKFDEYEYNGKYPKSWSLALLDQKNIENLNLRLRDKTKIKIPINDNNKWIFKDKKLSPREGDILFVEKVNNDYFIRQIPEVNGGIVAIDPFTGKILALVGGYNFGLSEFNRVTQAYRQPGSAFKPFVYLAALEDGFSPSTVILDAPYVVDQGPGLPKWKPSNYTKEFYGLSTMRLGIEKSRNLMTVRLAQKLGMEKIINVASRFKLDKNIDMNLSMALGAGEVTLLDLSNAYAMLANNGKRVKPGFIDTIQDRNGKIIFRHDERICLNCDMRQNIINQKLPEIIDDSEEVVDPIIAYQMVSMLEGVVLRGTGRKIKSLERPLAGKTGTTNDSKDAWFVGFSPNLVVGVYVGYDKPKSLGNGETGSSVAVPIFKEYMKRILSNNPKTPFRVASGVSFVKIDPDTGLTTTGENGIVEVFRQGREPFQKFILDDKSNIMNEDDLSGTGGLLLN
ncbi:MAG: penicillin-binding protein [Pelagibacteraceae bacterium]|nr:penicillin-binding protein [Pelagibacteraceae bacterium]PPR51577.1 MAG: Penicillin-binding protein 1A [Alphaproteobacteria bacterium MarineAlpha5_Bin10]